VCHDVFFCTTVPKPQHAAAASVATTPSGAAPRRDNSSLASIKTAPTPNARLITRRGVIRSPIIGMAAIKAHKGIV